MNTPTTSIMRVGRTDDCRNCACSHSKKRRGGFGRGRGRGGDRGRGRGRGRGGKEDKETWTPVTKLGRLVKDRKI
ncbi:hypothetical protein BG003_008431, partial [Podila horticola]